MTSLAEVYDSPRRDDLRRLYLGTGLFVAGAVLVLIGIAFFSTGIGSLFGLDKYGVREVAGVTAGLGVPAVFIGVFMVLPASGRERAAAAIGASVAIFGVILFTYAYPERWVAAGPGHLTLPVITVYFLGTITAFWALFTAVVNFKTRNDPGGTVTLTRVIDGETRRVEVPIAELDGRDLSGVGGLGGVGVVGDVDRDAVDRRDDAVVQTADRSGTAPASDGGTQAEALRTPGGTGGAAGLPTDRYCGNCAQFDYVRTDEGMQPYCGYYDHLMDDMDPCEHWESNAPR